MKPKILLNTLYTPQFFILAVALLCFTTESIAQSWELAKEKNGIKVYTRKQTTSKFKSIKVEASLEGSMDKLIKLLLDASGNKDWVYATNESYLIKRINANELISYTETTVPWPVSNRDVALHMNLLHDQRNNSLRVNIKGVPDAVPQKKGIVRIPYFSSSWDVKGGPRNKLNIVYFLEMDPGGTVPAWLMNLFVAKGPYETFTSLAQLIK